MLQLIWMVPCSSSGCLILGEALLSVTSVNLLTSNFCLEKGKALCCNVFCWRSKCSAGYLKEAFFSPKKWVQKFRLSCPWQLCHCWMPFFYRQLLLIGLLWLSVSALSKNDTVTGQEQEGNYFWCWARWGSTGDRTCSLLTCLWCLSNCEILSLGRSLCGSVSISQLL